MEIELAKSRGTYDKGVLFLDKGVTEVWTDTVWRHPEPDGGEVCSSPRSPVAQAPRLPALLLPRPYVDRRRHPPQAARRALVCRCGCRGWKWIWAWRMKTRVTCWRTTSARLRSMGQRCARPGWDSTRHGSRETAWARAETTSCLSQAPSGRPPTTGTSPRPWWCGRRGRTSALSDVPMCTGGGSCGPPPHQRRPARLPAGMPWACSFGRNHHMLSSVPQQGWVHSDCEVMVPAL